MTNETTGSTTSKGTTEMLIVDFGTKTRKQIQRLLKGQGALADDILDTIDELKRTGEIAGECQQPVVVVVKEREPVSRVGAW